MLRVCQQLASTVQNIEQSIIVKLRRLQICHCVQLNALFCCLCRNVEASCHKHFVVFSSNQHRRLLPATCHNLRHAGCAPPATAFTTPACCSVNTGSQARYRLRIAISAYHTCIRRPRYGGFPSKFCYAVQRGKTRMAWLPDGEKKLILCLFVSTESTNVTDTYTQTPHDGIVRAYAQRRAAKIKSLKIRGTFCK